MKSTKTETLSWEPSGQPGQSGRSSEIEEHSRKKKTGKCHNMVTLGPGEDFGSVLRVMRSPRRFMSRGKRDWTHDL